MVHLNGVTARWEKKAVFEFCVVLVLCRSVEVNLGSLGFPGGHKWIDGSPPAPLGPETALAPELF